MRDWGERDIAGMIDWIMSSLAPSKLLAVSHSVGGQMVALAHNNSLIASLIMIAAQNGYWKLYDAPRKYQQYISARLLVPVLTFAFGYLPMKRFRQGEDMPKGVALEWARWCLTPDYMFGDVELKSKENVKRFSGPILAYGITDDTWATSRAIDRLTRNFTEASVTYRRVCPSELDVSSIGHFGFFKPIFRANLWRESAEWLKHQGASL
jgi:predicted alpha/beta hydrolase